MIDYKKIIRSRKTRGKILEFLSFIPDKTMLKIQYRIKTGNKLNLKNPKRFTEKLQWYKLYYKNPLMIQCVDKYDVREYVKSKGLEDILIPCYGVYDSADEVDWDSLPQQFVMKDTLGGGGNSVVIVKDKSTVDLEDLKSTAADWTKIDAHKKGGGREYYITAVRITGFCLKSILKQMKDRAVWLTISFSALMEVQHIFM